jgi:hypothetical protein
MLGEEKLEFSVEDLGRLAKYIADKGIFAPLDIIYQFLLLQSPDGDRSGELIRRLQEGYND